MTLLTFPETRGMDQLYSLNSQSLMLCHCGFQVSTDAGVLQAQSREHHLQDIRALFTWLGIWNSDRAMIGRKLLAYLIPWHTPLIKQDIIFLKVPFNLELLQDTMQLKHKSRLSQAVMAHTSNLSSLEAEACRWKLGTSLL